mgnify:CR=1 FL=1
MIQKEQLDITMQLAKTLEQNVAQALADIASADFPNVFELPNDGLILAKEGTEESAQRACIPGNRIADFPVGSVRYILFHQ